MQKSNEKYIRKEEGKERNKKNKLNNNYILYAMNIYKKKYLNLLGFASKSGKIMFGDDDVILGLERSKVSLIIISEDMSQKAKEKFLKRLENVFENRYKYNGYNKKGITKEKIEIENKNIKVIIVGTKEENSSAVGKVNKPIIGICDNNLSKGIIKSILEEINGE
mgnify:FL=1